MKDVAVCDMPLQPDKQGARPTSGPSDGQTIAKCPLKHLHRLLPKQAIMPQPQIHRHEKPPIPWTSISMSKTREEVQNGGTPCSGVIEREGRNVRSGCGILWRFSQAEENSPVNLVQSSLLDAPQLEDLDLA